MTSNFDIKEFLRDADVQEALNRDDLLEVYNLLPTPMFHNLLTEYLVNNGINPIDYLSLIPSACFRCMDMERIYISSNIESMGISAFTRCKNLSEIIFEDGIKHIGHYAFSECTSISEIVLPNTLISIGNYAFENCDFLEKITIPESVVSIGTDILDGCNEVTILCNKDSTAHRYAIRNKIRYELIDNNGLNESLNDNNTLIEDITDIANEHKRIIDDIRKLFLDQDFVEEEKLNGIAFTQEINKPVNIISQFYIDTTDLSHESYIKSEDTSFNSNYANKGNIDSLQKAAALFINEFIQITTADLI